MRQHMCDATITFGHDEYPLICNIVHDDEWHYDSDDNVTWKEGKPDGV
jgi:hypothetical protein